MVSRRGGGVLVARLWVLCDSMMGMSIVTGGMVVGQEGNNSIHSAASSLLRSRLFTISYPNPTTFSNDGT